MAAIQDWIDTLVSWLKALVEFGLALAVVFLVIDILFPGQPIGIVDNVTGLVNIFVENGVVGLIALLFFLAIYQK